MSEEGTSTPGITGMASKIVDITLIPATDWSQRPLNVVTKFPARLDQVTLR